MTEIIGSPRSPKDLLSGPSQKKLADPCSPASFILGVLSGCVGEEQYGKQRIQDLSLVPLEAQMAGLMEQGQIILFFHSHFCPQDKHQRRVDFFHKMGLRWWLIVTSTFLWARTWWPPFLRSWFPTALQSSKHPSDSQKMTSFLPTFSVSWQHSSTSMLFVASQIVLLPSKQVHLEPPFSSPSNIMCSCCWFPHSIRGSGSFVPEFYIKAPTSNIPITNFRLTQDLPKLLLTGQWCDAVDGFPWKKWGLSCFCSIFLAVVVLSALERKS